MTPDVYTPRPEHHFTFLPALFEWKLSAAMKLWGAMSPLAKVTPSPSAITTAGGTANHAGINPTGGNGTYSWELVSGALPPGISLKSSGLFSGTPTTPGNYATPIKFTLNYSFSDGTQQFSFTYTYTLNATLTVVNGTGPATWRDRSAAHWARCRSRGRGHG